MKKAKEKRAWRFTALDLIILLAIAAVIVFAFYFFGSFRQNRGSAETIVNIEYTIEIKRIKDIYVGNIRVGDTVIDSVTKKGIGTITAVENTPMIEYLLNTDEGIVEEKEYPGYSTMLITISSPATRTEKGYTINSYRVAIGGMHYLQLPKFQGSGYCIGVQEQD